MSQTWGGTFIQLGCPEDAADRLEQLANLRGWLGLTATQSIADANASFVIARSNRPGLNAVSETGLEAAIRSFIEVVEVVDVLAIGTELGVLDRGATRLRCLESRPRVIALAHGLEDIANLLQRCGYMPVSDGETWSIYCRAEDARTLPSLLRQPTEAEIGWSAGRDEAYDAALAKLRSRLDEGSEEVRRLQHESARSRRQHAGEVSRLRAVVDHLADELSRVNSFERDPSRDSESLLLATGDQAELGAARIFRTRFRRGRFSSFSTTKRTAEMMQRRRALVLQSGLFDGAWYLHQNQDVAERGLDPLSHFVDYGSLEGRDPGPAFNTQRYLGAYPDVAESKVEPFLHYVIWGRRERRLDWRLQAS